MLQSNQFSFAIPGGVHIVIMGCTRALQCNLAWYLLEIDFANTHSDCNRGNIWKELERDSYFHFLIQIFLDFYGETAPPNGTSGTAPISLP